MNNILIQSAKDAGLKYTNENDLCFRRAKNGKGFIYFDEEGNPVKNNKLLERFKSLVIPPAWESVKICASEMGHIQATGRDAKGRKQYIYHPRWTEVSNSNKFGKMIEFGEALPLIRKHVERDLKKKSLPLEKVLAVIIKLLEETLIRVGNRIYAETNNSFGLTTLQDRHLKVKGSNLKFEFTGKSGKLLQLDYNDKKLARLVKQCQDSPGQHLFQYFDEEGKRHPVESDDVNIYLNKIVEKNFTAKDFRTWGGTVIAVKELFSMPLSEFKKENERNVVKAVKIVASALNNTPAICRKYYIHPYIIESYLEGKLFKVIEKTLMKRRHSKFGLTAEEKALLVLLKKYSKRKTN